MQSAFKGWASPSYIEVKRQSFSSIPRKAPSLLQTPPETELEDTTSSFTYLDIDSDSDIENCTLKAMCWTKITID